MIHLQTWATQEPQATAQQIVKMVAVTQDLSDIQLQPTAFGANIAFDLREGNVRAITVSI